MVHLLQLKALCVLFTFFTFSPWSSHPAYHIISFILLQKILQVAMPSCTTVAFVIANNLCVFEYAYCVQVNVCVCLYWRKMDWIWEHYLSKFNIESTLKTIEIKPLKCGTHRNNYNKLYNLVFNIYLIDGIKKRVTDIWKYCNIPWQASA